MPLLGAMWGGGCANWRLEQKLPLLGAIARCHVGGVGVHVGGLNNTCRCWVPLLGAMWGGGCASWRLEQKLPLLGAIARCHVGGWVCKLVA